MVTTAPNPDPLGSETADQTDYLLRHLAEHLFAAGRFADLNTLITRHWMVLKRTWLGSDQSLTQDLDLAIAASRPMTAGELPRLFWHCLLSSTLNVLATNAPPERLGIIAAAGKVDEALAITDRVNEPLRKAWGLHHIATAVAEGGKPGAALPLWEQARSLATAQRPQPASGHLQEIGALTRRGELSAAADLLAIKATEGARTVDRTEEGRLLAAIARSMIETGLPTEGVVRAIEAAKPLFPEPGNQGADTHRGPWTGAASGLADIAETETLLRRRECAVATLRQAFECLRMADSELFRHEHTGMAALSAIVAGMARAEDRGGLQEVWRLLEDGDIPLAKYGKQAHGMAVFAQGCADGGDTWLARSALQAAWSRFLVLSRMPGVPRRRTRTSQILEPSSRVRPDVDTAAALALAAALVRARDEQTADGGAQSGQYPWLLPPDTEPFSAVDRLNLLGHLRRAGPGRMFVDWALAQVDAQVDRLQAAERAEVMEHTASSHQKRWTLRLAKGASRIGVPGAALITEHFRDAEMSEQEQRAAEPNRNAVCRCMAYAATAAALAVQGQRDLAAQRFVQAIRETTGLSFDREETEAAILELALRSGLAFDVGLASDNARRDWQFSGLYTDMAVILAGAGRNTAAAGALADAMRDLSDDADDFALDVAPMLASVGWRAGLEQLVSAALELSCPERQLTLAQLAKPLAQIGSPQDAKRLMRSASHFPPSIDGVLEKFAERPFILGAMAEAYAEMGQFRKGRRMTQKALSAVETITGKNLKGRLLRSAEKAYMRVTGASAAEIDDVTKEGPGDREELGMYLGLLARPAMLSGDERTIRRIVAWLETFGDPAERVTALIELVEFSIGGGIHLADSYWQILSQALADAVVVTDGLENALELLIRLATQQGEVGDAPGLEATVAAVGRLLPGPNEHDAQCVLAPALAAVGDHESVARACYLVESMADADWKQAVLPKVLLGLTRLLANELTACQSRQMMVAFGAALRAAETTTATGQTVEELAHFSLAMVQWARAPDLATRALIVARDHAEVLRDTNPEGLAQVAASFASAGRQREACELLSSGVIVARQLHEAGTLAPAGRGRILEYLRSAVPALAALDSSAVVLVDLWTQVHDIEDWWAGAP